MSYEINEHHAKTLAEIIDQSSHWKLHPEKKPPFKNTKEVNEYVQTHNEPLCIRVPIANTDDHLTVKVTSQDEDVIFSTISFDNPAESRVHASHLKNASSVIMEMLNEKLPEGQKVASF
tara:strand:- start:147 stop:503 length:357 start_codon:yes stop_codon:yes gene_type:complete